MLVMLPILTSFLLKLVFFHQLQLWFLLLRMKAGSAAAAFISRYFTKHALINLKK